jgi:hypothetical protein
MEWTSLRADIVATAAKVGSLLRLGERPLSRVTWSALQTGAHLMSLCRRYRRTIEAPQPLPASLARDNETELAAVPERDPGTLADLLEAEVSSLLDALGDDGELEVWYFSRRHTVRGIGGIMLAELLVHGRDLAMAHGRPWPITRAQAAACFAGLLPMLTLFVDPDGARAAAGTYHLRLRGGEDWTIRVHDGTADIEPGRPRRADLHISADPVTFLLNSYGHVSDARAALTGGIVAWGRRPWLAIRFRKVFAET